ncbi:MAG: GDSL-type esterase/lipase family protein [Planctomycetes bacterium]|nr:GDSL-type esterase/lipase family protein [Planctomycetota bacterium]
MVALCAALAGCDAEPAAPATRVLALGDSYTIGEGVRPADRWPVLLVERLRASGARVADPELIARTGWTTDELARAIERARPAGPYDLVTLCVGVNDQFRGRPLDETRPRFAALVARAAGLAGDRPGRVLVLSVPDWGVTPFAAGRDRAAIAREIDALNAMARAEVERAGARWLEVTATSRRAADEPALLADDGLHPSAAMYARWAEAALPLAREALAGS